MYDFILTIGLIAAQETGSSRLFSLNFVHGFPLFLVAIKTFDDTVSSSSCPPDKNTKLRSNVYRVFHNFISKEFASKPILYTGYLYQISYSLDLDHAT